MNNDFKINIYPIAYVCIDNIEIMDYLQSDYDSLCSGDGQLLFNIEELEARLEEMEPSGVKSMIKEILSAVEGKSTDIYFYTR
jgi:hypothetical protein